MVDLWSMAVQTIKGKPFKVSYLGEGNSNSIMDCLLSLQSAAQDQTKTFAENLQRIYGNNVPSLLRDLYQCIVANVRLRYDPIGRQFIRKPSNIVVEKACDCKSYSLFISSILSNLGIKNFFRFVSFEPGQEIRHVYIIVPYNGHNYVLDCNLKTFDREYPYYKKVDKMAIISSIGKVQSRTMPMSVAEVELVTEIATLKSTKKTPSIKRSAKTDAYIGKAIEYRKDMLDTVRAARTNNVYAKQLPYLIGAIKHDWNTGKYHSLSREELLENRKQEWDNGQRYYDSEIAGKFWKMVGNAFKTIGKTIAGAVWKTIKGTGKAIGSSFKLAFDTAVLTSTLPALITKRGREKWSGQWENVVADLEKQRDAIKEVTLAPINTLFEEVLDNMMEAGPFFLYYYCIPENKVYLYPNKVQVKWKKQKECFEKILKFLAVDRSRLMEIVGNSIKAEMNMSPEEVLDVLKLAGSADEIEAYMKSKTPDEIVTAALSEKQDSELGEGIGAVLFAIAMVMYFVAKIVAYILKLISAIKKGEDLDDYAAAADDFANNMGSLAISINGSTDENGNFNLSKFAETIAQNSKNYSSTGSANNTYAQLWQLCYNLANKDGNEKEETSYYTNLANYFLQAGNQKGLANKIEPYDLIKMYDYMAKADGITEPWNIAKSQMTSLNDYADGYKKLLSAGVSTDRFVSFFDSLSDADKNQVTEKILSSESGKASSGQGIATEMALKADGSWWWILAAVGVGGYFLYKSGKNKKGK